MCVLAIGNFDGVHAGHRTLLAVAHALAKQHQLPLNVLTFEPHPREVLTGVPLKRLMTKAEKETALHAVGVAQVQTKAFDLAFAQTSPQAFIEDILVQQLGATHVVVGENFRFGYKAAGDIALLQGQKTFTTHAVPLVKDSGGVVSSQRLREAL